MHDQSLIDELLDRWEDARQNGESLSIDELCSEHPTIRDEVARRIAALEVIDGCLATDADKGTHDSIDTTVELDEHLPPHTVDTRAANGGNAQADGYQQIGNYQIQEELARGGMGVVYKARHVLLNRTVALKMILGGLPEEQGIQRFLAEAEAAANLDHPNIVQVFEVGEDRGRHFLAMAFIEGRSLAQHIAESPVTSREAASITYAICEAIAFAHERGIVHRDLKPANVLLATASKKPDSGQNEGPAENASDAGFIPKVTDFGLAKRMSKESGLTVTGQILGTPSYMAPEQAAGETSKTGPAADIYAIGAILYCLMTGRAPFRAGTVMETLQQVIAEEPVSPRRLNPSIEADLETICLKCLHKQPSQRYSSAFELGCELQRFLNHEPIQARPAGLAERGWKWIRRNPVTTGVAGLASATIASLLVAAVAFYYQGQLSRANDKLVRTNQTLHDTNDQLENALSDTEVARNNERRAKEKLDEVLYVRRVKLAHAKYLEGEVAAARKLLEECPQNVRGWEWRYVSNLCGGNNKTVEFEGPITLVAAFPHSNRVAVYQRYVGKFSNILIASLDGDGIQQKIDLPDDALVQEMQVSPDGKWIAAAGGVQATAEKQDEAGTKTALRTPHHISIWDVRSGERLRQFDCGEYTFSVCISPDGRKIAGSFHNGQQTGVRIWDYKTGEKLHELVTAGKGLSCAFSPDGKRLATARTGVEWSPSGRKLLSATAVNVEVWDTATGQRIWASKTDPAEPLSEILTVWDAATGEVKGELHGHAGRVAAVAYSPDGKKIVSGSWDKTARVWDAATYQHLSTTTTRYAGAVSLAMLSDGRRFAIADISNSITIQEIPPNAVASNTGKISAFSSSGRYLAVGDYGGFLQDLKTQQWTKLHDGENESGPAKPRKIMCVAFSRDESVLALGGIDGKVTLWDVASAEKRGELVGHRVTAHPNTPHALRPSAPTPFGVTYVTFDPTGEKLLSTGGDGTIRVWDIESQTQLVKIDHQRTPIRVAEFLPSGETIITSPAVRGGVNAYNAQTGEAVDDPRYKQILVGNTIFVTPDGRRLITGGKVWNLENIQPLTFLEGYRSSYEQYQAGSMTMLPDGRRLATNGADGTVRLWDIETGEELFVAKRPNTRSSENKTYAIGYNTDMECLVSLDDKEQRYYRVKPYEGPPLQPLGLVARYEYDGGVFEQLPGPRPFQWRELGDDTFYFDEVRRDQSHIILYDKSRKLTLRIPVQGGQIAFSWDREESWTLFKSVKRRLQQSR